MYIWVWLLQYFNSAIAMEGDARNDVAVAEIKSILFCEFDPVAGPKITFQVS